MCTHLCTSSLELIFSDDEFGDDAEHAWTLKQQLNAYDMLCVYLLLHIWDWAESLLIIKVILKTLSTAAS